MVHKRIFATTLMLIGSAITLATPTVARDLTGLCDTDLVGTKLIDGEFEAAQAETQRCATNFNSEMAKGGDFNNMASLDFMIVGNALHYYEANAQLQALLGNFGGAESSRNTAETIKSSNPNFQSFLLKGAVDEVSSETNGLILEKRGELTEAKRIYTLNGSLYAKGRLALLALNASDYGEAQQRATEGSMLGDATSYAVLGALAERAGDKSGAFLDYKKAHDLLLSAPKGTVPIFYAEASRITRGLTN